MATTGARSPFQCDNEDVVKPVHSGTMANKPLGTNLPRFGSLAWVAAPDGGPLMMHALAKRASNVSWAHLIDSPRFRGCTDHFAPRRLCSPDLNTLHGD